MKSGTNAATEIDIGYRDNGSLNALFILQGDSVVERYTFFYNTSNQLVKVITHLDPIDSKSAIYHTRDTIIYPTSVAGTYPSNIIRYSPYDATLAGTFTMSVCSSCTGSSTGTVNIISFQTYTLSYNQGDCNSSDYYPYSCGGINRSTNGGGSNNGQNQLNFQSNITYNKSLQTSFTSADKADSYYFHPLMILKDVVPQGGFYFWFYSIDWFQTTGGTYTNNDLVKVNLNYGQ